jgi:uncharacterized protein
MSTTMKSAAIRITAGVALLVFAPAGDAGGAEGTGAAGRRAVRPFELNRVRILDGPFKLALERDRAYLRELEIDRLLHTFRINAGLPTTARPLGGWEEPTVELRGHFIGHYLSACAQMYASVGDAGLKARADSVVSALAHCQAALGNGYLSAFPESFIERAETGKRVWAPWYTLHKIMAGLLDMYSLAGNREALEVLVRFAGWAKKRTDRLDDAAMQKMLQVEFGGMNEVMRNLYGVTGNPDHLSLARRFDHAFVLEPLAAHQDRLKGLHANTQIPKIVGAAREYEISGNRTYHDIAAYFWDEVVGARTYATGGTSYDEHWGSEPYRIATHLGRNDHETCCTYNLMKLTRHLFSWNPDIRYADYYERALLNGILPVQNPADGMTMYYVPMGQGLYKTFGSKRESFWCCTGTGVELFASPGLGTYFADDDRLFVNLYLPSELDWKEKGVTIVQTTSFPEQQGTTITVRTSKPVQFALNLRIPGWTAAGGKVAVNGKDLDVFAGPGSYLSLKRLWKNGDRVSLTLPMDLHLDRTPDNPNRGAIMYGPIVLAGELGVDSAATGTPPGEYGPSGDPVPVPYFRVASDDLHSWITPEKGQPLTFAARAADRAPDVRLVPFYRLFGQRYSIYWDVYRDDEWRELTARAGLLPEGTVDSLGIGDDRSESLHNYQGFQVTRGSTDGRAWLACKDWVKFDFTLPAGHPSGVVLTMAEPDSANAYAVSVDGRVLERASSFPAGGGRTCRYLIPPDYAAGKKSAAVIVRVARPGSSFTMLGAALSREKSR